MNALIGLLILIVIAPLVFWLARGLGRKARKGSPGLALLLFGLGQPFDPPREHPSETVDRERRGSRVNEAGDEDR